LTDPFHKEQLGELTKPEVEAIISHLEWVERFSDLLDEMRGPTVLTDVLTAGEMADRLERLLQRAQRRRALDALEKGQCEGTVSRPIQLDRRGAWDDPPNEVIERCELVKGHDGPCSSDPED